MWNGGSMRSLPARGLSWLHPSALSRATAHLFLASVISCKCCINGVVQHLSF